MMKTILAGSFVSVLALGLTNCGSMLSQAGTTGSRVVGTGVGVVGTGVNVIAGTGKAVVNTVGTSVNLLTGQRANYQDNMRYRQNGVIYRDGNAYRITNGRYILAR
ncbi:MAG: hypothetical protein H0U70_09480 [Tatlockia sp.]|nr:hypothetical protein [Tatlockia sp.]